MNSEKKIWHQGACHCGAIKFKVRAPVNIALTACNCTMCHMTRFLHLIVETKDFHLLSGADNITTYTFNTNTAKHTFCKTCGIKPFYTPRSHPDGISVNFKCVDQSSFETVASEDFDGRNWADNVVALREK